MTASTQSTAHPVRVALYARDSTENQREASIEDQVRVCRATTEQNGWTVVQTYADYAVSGTTLARPGYQSILADARADHFAIVVAESACAAERNRKVA